MSIDTPDFEIPSRDRDNARPQFYVETYLNDAKTREEGRPVHQEREMVKILVPGDRLTEHVTIVSEQHRMRWPREYEAFKANREAPLTGTPIDELAGVSKAQIEDLKYMKVRTIEDLAGLPDDLLRKVAPMNGTELRNKAQRRLDYEAGAAPMEKLAAESAQKDATIAEMQAQIAEMQKTMAAFAAAKA